MKGHQRIEGRSELSLKGNRRVILSVLACTVLVFWGFLPGVAASGPTERFGPQTYAVIPPVYPPFFLGQWGSSVHGDGEFFRPEGVAVDNSLKMYVADTNNNRIQLLSTLIRNYGDVFG